MRSIIFLLGILSTSAYASSFSEKVTWVESTEGFSREIQTTTEAANDTLSFQLQYTQGESDTFTQSLTYKPTTYTEVKGIYSQSDEVKTTGAGASNWVTDQLQFGLELSRSEMESEQILNSDFDTIDTAPTVLGMSVFLKQLVNPTTIATYSVLSTKSETDQRYFGSLELKHYFSEQDFGIGGLIGAGKGEDLKTYEASAWIGKAFGDALYTLRYRAYVEKGEFLYGSDALETAAAYKLETWTGKLVYVRYLNNRDFQANLYSLEITKEF